MNVVDLINVLLKVLHPSVFQISLTAEEKEIERKFNSYNFHTKLNLSLQNDTLKNTVLTWCSNAQKIIACPVNEEGFMFSEIGVFADGMVIDLQTYFNFDREAIGTIQEEAVEIKSLLRMLSKDMEEYCKGNSLPAAAFRRRFFCSLENL